MKRYLKNLWLALKGQNPFRQELEEEKKLRTNAEAELRRFVCLHEKASAARAAAEKKVMDYQNLTENLRQRILEKDVELHEQSVRYSDAVTALRRQHKRQREELERRLLNEKTL